jgi:cell division protein FtsL
MLDLAEGVEDRNYGLRRAGAARSLLEALQIVLPVAMIAAALTFYVWVRGRLVQAGYQAERLQAQEEELLETGRRLLLEEQTLKDPDRLEAAARDRLGLISIRPWQVIPAPLLDRWDTSSSREPGPAKSNRFPEPEKASAFN